MYAQFDQDLPRKKSRVVSIIIGDTIYIGCVSSVSVFLLLGSPDMMVSHLFSEPF